MFKEVEDDSRKFLESFKEVEMMIFLEKTLELGFGHN
jgi:hypothetical protein